MKTTVKPSKTYRLAVCSDKKPAAAGFFIFHDLGYYYAPEKRSEKCLNIFTEHDELVSDVVACQLVIKQILDVIDIIAPVEVREKMTTQLKAIDFASHPASADPVTLRAVQKAIALIELKFTPQEEAH